jgi:hypothetical protein
MGVPDLSHRPLRNRPANEKNDQDGKPRFGSVTPIKIAK